LASWIRIRNSELWIRILNSYLPKLQINLKNKLHYFILLKDLLSIWLFFFIDHKIVKVGSGSVIQDYRSTTLNERCGPFTLYRSSAHIILSSWCTSSTVLVRHAEGWNVLLAWARIFKRVWSPGIDTKEWIPPAYVVWRAGTITLFLLGSWPP
jgi:hypothetical protein